MAWELSTTLRNALLTGIISFLSALLAAQDLTLHVVLISFLGAALGAALSYQSVVNPGSGGSNSTIKSAALKLLSK